ncbi:alkylhydroperoxidase AhpD family core domain-containing protein [Ensifer adhaerens]|nr:alkylhydroperoxidase AhpD family core domain-containing protein [Ensifer adhaerens]
MTDVRERLKDAQRRLGGYAKSSAEVFAGFSRLSKAATAEGQLSPAQKELMAVAIAVTKGCEDCILYHVDAAIRHGAGESEIVEALDVAVEMGGGPALMYAGKALEFARALR